MTLRSGHPQKGWMGADQKWTFVDTGKRESKGMHDKTVDFFYR